MTGQKLNQRMKKLVTFILVTLLLPLMPTNALANTESELNFYVTPVLPESQLEGGASGYFDLNLGAGQTDTLGFDIENGTEEAIDVEITAHTAFTNVNGVVEYGKDAEEVDPTLPASIGELIDAPGKIRLEANEKQRIEFPINMPEESFDGVLAGGIRIQETKPEEQQEDEGEGLAIKNAFSYVVGVVVSNNRSATDPGLELLDVFADQVNYRNVFSAQIQNFTSTFINKLEVEATVREEGQSDILYEVEQEGMQMAPNSHFNFPIPLNGDRFRSGTYVLNLTARSGEEEWSWEKTFTVTADDARRLNREDVTVEDSVNWWMIAILILLLLVVCGIGYLIWKSKKKEVTEHKE